MSLIYTLISKQGKDSHIILCDYTTHNGNFQQVSTIILNNLNINKNKWVSLNYERYFYSLSYKHT